MRKRVALLAAAAVLAAAGTAAEEEITKTPPALEFEAVTATCEKILAPHLLSVQILGECALLGVQPVAKDEPYFRAGVEFLRTRVYNQEVRVEVCPNIPVNETGQKRAVIYYREEGEWRNLNIELIRAGLAKVADVPGCHVPTKAWLEYEKEARREGSGIWAGQAEPGRQLSPEPDISDFD